MLKEAQYPCFGAGMGGREFNKVVYYVNGRECYFSGIELTNRTSTVNAAESIIRIICDQEGIYWEEARFFDLKTHLGYPIARGEYELNELSLVRNSHGPQPGSAIDCEIDGEPTSIITQPLEVFSVAGWVPTPCPPEIQEVFREYIG